MGRREQVAGCHDKGMREDWRMLKTEWGPEYGCGDPTASSHLEIIERALGGDWHDEMRMGPLLPYSFALPGS